MGKTSSMAKLALDWEPSTFNSKILVTLVISCIQYILMSFSRHSRKLILQRGRFYVV